MELQDYPDGTELVCRGIESKSGLLLDGPHQMYAAHLTLDVQTLEHNIEGSEVVHKFSLWMSVTAMRAVRDHLNDHIEEAERHGWG